MTNRAQAIKYAQRFRWGFENAVGGSDDWRCDMQCEYDEFGDRVDDEDRDPCECPECAGATARMWSKDGKLPLSIRITLNLAKKEEATR